MSDLCSLKEVTEITPEEDVALAAYPLVVVNSHGIPVVGLHKGYENEREAERIASLIGGEIWD